MAARRHISSRLRAASCLGPAQWRTVGAMATVIVVLHAIGFGLLLAVVVPAHLRLGASGALAGGTGVTAYTLGLRHALDADHISAIDNTTRKLMAEGRRPMSVGFFFSLGHSTVVFGLAFGLAAGLHALAGPLVHGRSALHSMTSLIGTGVSGTFLYLIAAVNAVILWGIVKVVRRLRAGDCDEAALEHELASAGLMNRVFGRFARAIVHPWQMYPVGVLFGLGFDTASEVALLFLAAGAAGSGLPFYAVLCLPVLFAAGMTLLDTIDGSFMSLAYGWAFARPARRVFYNLTITGLSVAVAFVIGTIELGGLLARRLNMRGAFWSWWEHVSMNTLGLIIAAMFLITWAAAVGIWRIAGIEKRWAPSVRDGAAPLS
ncbi:MAG TPA: HoxN/HupN/NixA family nickel/cobalt transporter [Solirubrobacteraceae bacterium]|nr:HoxN/HupN/NixA family nickel/cobalt transporter [Solirubrobacteraceae bacterium]